MQCNCVLQEQIVLSLCVCLSCLAPQVALFHREHARRECLQTVSQIFPVLSEEPSSLCKRLSSISCKQDFSFIHRKAFCVLRCPRSITDWIGLDWVTLESLTRDTSPKDCWTSFQTSCCSTVEPNWSFPLVQLWSCLHEIFGGGRGDKYGLHTELLQFSIFQLLECNELEVSPWRIIAFDRVW